MALSESGTSRSETVSLVAVEVRACSSTSDATRWGTSDGPLPAATVVPSGLDTVAESLDAGSAGIFGPSADGAALSFCGWDTVTAPSASPPGARSVVLSDSAGTGAAPVAVGTSAAAGVSGAGEGGASVKTATSSDSWVDGRPSVAAVFSSAGGSFDDASPLAAFVAASDLGSVRSATAEARAELSEPTPCESSVCGRFDRDESASASGAAADAEELAEPACLEEASPEVSATGVAAFSIGTTDEPFSFGVIVDGGGEGTTGAVGGSADLAAAISGSRIEPPVWLESEFDSVTDSVAAGNSLDAGSGARETVVVSMLVSASLDVGTFLNSDAQSGSWECSRRAKRAARLAARRNAASSMAFCLTVDFFEVRSETLTGALTGSAEACTPAGAGLSTRTAAVCVSGSGSVGCRPLRAERQTVWLRHFRQSLPLL